LDDDEKKDLPQVFIYSADTFSHLASSDTFSHSGLGNGGLVGEWGKWCVGEGLTNGENGLCVGD